LPKGERQKTISISFLELFPLRSRIKNGENEAFGGGMLVSGPFRRFLHEMAIPTPRKIKLFKNTYLS
jgi:hypothetical protein